MAAVGYIGLLLGIISISYALETCPPRGRFSNLCLCSTDRGVVEVFCYNAKDPAILLRDVQKFRGYNISMVFLMNMQLPYLPAGLFLGMSVKRLIIDRGNLDNLYSITDYEPSPFAGLEDSLEELQFLQLENPSKWYYPDLKGLKHLKKVTFEYSPLNFVGSVFGDIGQGSVENFTATYSNVYRIHPQAFTKNTNLKEVNFRGNSIPYVVRTMFPEPANFLWKIDLSENKLFNLPENMFDNMPALEYLDLSGNEFKTFQVIPAYNNLKAFYISANPFECGCHLLPLKNLKSKQNDMKYVQCIDTESNKTSYVTDLSAQDLKCY